MFAEIDTNGDGEITREEISAAPEEVLRFREGCQMSRGACSKRILGILMIFFLAWAFLKIEGMVSFQAKYVFVQDFG